MKPKLTLNSMADMPVNALSLAASMPARAVNASTQMLGATLRATRREIRASRQQSIDFARGIYARVNTPFQNIQPWQRGGINE